MTNDQNRRHAAALRDHATRRVRRMTAAVLAGSAALTGVFFGVAKASTHFSSSSSSSTGSAGATTTPSGPVTAPTPSLVQNGSSPGQVPQSPVPSVAQNQPVVVSGGS